MSLLDLTPPRDHIAAIEADLRINIHELGVDVKELELSGNPSTIVEERIPTLADKVVNKVCCETITI
jgi:hypothetical protein